MRYEKVKSKLVQDSDGFYTDYTWYKDENGYNVFVFGDSDLYLPEDGEYDWETESDKQAEEWFDNYNGFEDEDSLHYDEDDSKNYTVETVTRYKETASPYDDPEDMYETAYIIRDKYGDIIYDTTNYDIVKEYIGEGKKSLKESRNDRFELEVWVPGSGGDDDRERTLLVSSDMDEIIKKAYDTELDYDEAFYLRDTRGIFNPDLDQEYSAEQLEDDIYSVWRYDPIESLARELGKKLLPQRESLKENLEEDTVKQGNYWVNKGKEGTHGKFKTKKEAEAQRKAMFARGFKESKNLKEMNDRELEDAEQKMWQETRERTGKKDVWFKDVDKKTHNTLSAIRMINSVLAYHWVEGETAEELLDKELNRYKSYLQEYVDKLGREKVLELIENQMNDIDHIARNVITDSEGLSYNRIVWKNK